MTDLTPKNIADASMMANAWAKASRLVAEGYKFIELCTIENSPVSLVAVYKPGETVPAYFIRAGFTEGNGCSCPAFAKTGRYCKHTFCLEDRKLEEAAILEYFAQMENAECANGVDYLL